MRKAIKGLLIGLAVTVLAVPVDITLNFNGELEQIVNTGLGYSNLLKGNQK